jgi:hypothetical protein
MDKLVYGLFADHAGAQKAVDALLHAGVPDSVIDLVMHEGTVVRGDFAGPATGSRKYFVLGGTATAVVGAALGGLVTGWIGAALGLVVGGMLGSLVAMLSGADEPKEKLNSLVEEVRKGRVLVTIDISSRSAGVDCERYLDEHGAVQVGMV